jgi:hypothetical protein
MKTPVLPVKFSLSSNYDNRQFIMGTRGRGSLATPRGSLFGGGGSGTGGSGVNSYIDLENRPDYYRMLC